MANTVNVGHPSMLDTRAIERASRLASLRRPFVYDGHPHVAKDWLNAPVIPIP
jgi:hypothetical protein